MESEKAVKVKELINDVQSDGPSLVLPAVRIGAQLWEPFGQRESETSGDQLNQ